MATVKMKRGGLYADIYDSPETIAQAESEGYVLVKDEPKPVREVVKEETPKTTETKSRTKRQ